MRKHARSLGGHEESRREREFIVRARSNVWGGKSDCGVFATGIYAYLHVDVVLERRASTVLLGDTSVKHPMRFEVKVEDRRKKRVKIFFSNVNKKILRIPQTESLLNLSESVSV